MESNEGYFIEDLSVGMSSTFAKAVTDGDIVAFAEVSGDNNPLHLDDAYAKETMFGGRIAQGMLSASLLSAVLGTQLPGPGSIYLSQTLKFRAPVKVGDHVSAVATITALESDRGRVTLSCRCSVGDTVVVDGEAQVLVPSRST